tara:strand:+ start:83 stop:238 length:156 start_codon:yes stop_codon:yes gene_type:complete
MMANGAHLISLKREKTIGLCTTKEVLADVAHDLLLSTIIGMALVRSSSLSD